MPGGLGLSSRAIGMILLSLQAELRPQQACTALTEARHLGGVLHGSVADLLIRHAPSAAEALGMGGANPDAFRRYAILPPPYGWAPPQDGSAAWLGFGLMLYGDAVEQTTTVAGALNHWRELRVGRRVDRVSALRIQACRPGRATRLVDPEALSLGEPDDEPAFAPCSGLGVEWLTPLQLDGSAQRAAGVTGQVPSLLRVVRSLSRRVAELEPVLARKLGLGTADWIAAEETIRRLPVGTGTLRPAPWRYSSRNHSKPVHFSGLIGRTYYPGPIPAPIHALLHWGCWFGAGQRTALGQGMYRIGEEPYDTTKGGT